jgi:hypothetical protein
MIRRDYDVGIALTLFIAFISSVTSYYYYIINDPAWSIFLFPTIVGVFCTVWIWFLKRNWKKLQEELNGKAENKTKGS